MKKLGKSQRAVLNHLETVEIQQTTTEIQTALSMSQDQCLNALRRLFERNLVMRLNRNGEYVWALTPVEMDKQSHS